MTDIVSLSKALTADIQQMVQQEQEIKNRIKQYKQLVEDKKAHSKTLADLMAEEAALMKELGEV
jgi:Tfp pilus assembly protein PilN